MARPEDFQTIREWDDYCLREAVEAGYGTEAEIRRQWRAWDLELLDETLGLPMRLAEDDDQQPHQAWVDRMTAENSRHDPLELLTIAQVGRLLKMHRSTVRKMIDTGEIRGVQLVRGDRQLWRVPRLELERYLRSLGIEVEA